jgi:hypothetical protein
MPLTIPLIIQEYQYFSQQQKTDRIGCFYWHQ